MVFTNGQLDPDSRGSPRHTADCRIKSVTSTRVFLFVFCVLPLSGLLFGCGSGGTESRSPTSPSEGLTRLFKIDWVYSGQAWKPSGEPPSCANPLIFVTPVTLSEVTSILYPGQTRGGWYKPHGGFRFDGPSETGEITTLAPMTSTVYRGGRYVMNGEIQYTFDFINACGILHRLDHLRGLSPRFQRIADSLPTAVPGDSRTFPVASGQNISAGETIATSVGFGSGNFFLDWGVYDLRERNKASTNATWLAQHPGELAAYAICWLDHLAPGDGVIIRALPAADSRSGASSDYCY